MTELEAFIVMMNRAGAKYHQNYDISGNRHISIANFHSGYEPYHSVWSFDYNGNLISIGHYQ